MPSSCETKCQKKILCRSGLATPSARLNGNSPAQQYQKLKDLIRDYKVAELNFSGGVRFLHLQEISLILRAQENIKLYSKASHIPEPVPFYVHVKRKNGLKNPSFLACSEHDGDLNYFYRYPDAQVKYWL